MFDVIVVGSGPAGVFSAYQLRPLKVLMLDVGYESSKEVLPKENIYNLRKKGIDLFSSLIGNEFESLINLDHTYMSPKLKGPLWKFVTKRPSSLPDDERKLFDPVTSFAKGGLANTWGAGVLRFDDRDLDGFPIKATELDPYYDELTKHIGINGQKDDLTRYFGSLDNLLSPIPLSPLSTDLYNRYSNKKEVLNKLGITIGRTRAAILTQPHRGREEYRILGQDFFQPNSDAIYHPGYTLDELVNEKSVEYRNNFLVKKFEETEGGVKVFAENLATGAIEQFEAKKLFLAAGSINTARIVLESKEDYITKLPILDNPVSFIPMINFTKIGSALPVYSFSGGELIALYEGGNYPRPVQASFYGLGAPLKTDLVGEFPLPLRSSLTAGKYLLPALAMLQVFYPDEENPDNFLRLRKNGSLDLAYKSPKFGKIEKKFISAFMRLGFFSSTAICKYPAPGSSIHYAGSLPMKDKPVGPYQTDRLGKLNETKNVYIADAANFSRLPSKNHTFTIMANAMRIAEGVKKYF